MGLFLQKTNIIRDYLVSIGASCSPREGGGVRRCARCVLRQGWSVMVVALNEREMPLRCECA